eukprot:3669319-Prymnesium_polylepis.1
MDREFAAVGPVGATWTSTGVTRCRETVLWAASFWRVPLLCLAARRGGAGCVRYSQSTGFDVVR